MYVNMFTYIIYVYICVYILEPPASSSPANHRAPHGGYQGNRTPEQNPPLLSEPQT